MAVVLVAVSQADRAASVPRVAATADQQDDGEQDDDVGVGPPAWSRANGKGRGHGADRAWKEPWQKLTPVQKGKKMAALVKAHEQGMNASQSHPSRPVPAGRGSERGEVVGCFAQHGLDLGELLVEHGGCGSGRTQLT